MTLAAGTRLGPYEILAPLGAGGMGEVYRAKDERLSREVAIKVLPSELASDAERLKRFEKEARSASALNHPNIVTIYDIGSSEGVSWIAMERVEGATLRELLASGPLPVRRLLQIAPQIAEGLAKAHEAGIVHRDLKPENVMVTKDGLVKVLDFGLAKLTSTMSGSGEGSHLPTMTGTTPGVVVGTVGYMSPEQASGEAVDFRSDQFSFGSILYEMATGKRAFQKKTAIDTLGAILNTEPEPISTINPQVPAPLRWIDERCLSKEAESRYASTKDLARELANLRDHLSEAGISASTTAAPSIRRRSLVLPALLLLALAASVGAAFLVGKRSSHQALLSFRQLTFRLGSIGSARFAPDGQTVVYDMKTEGRKRELFTTRLGHSASRSLGLEARVFAISVNSELALQLRGHILALMPLGGGAPRELLEGVWDADWSPDGKSLAVVHEVNGKFLLEYPIGNVLFTTTKQIANLHISKTGELVAFQEMNELFNNEILVVDRKGKRRALGIYTSEYAWSLDGGLMFIQPDPAAGQSELRLVDLAGRQRSLMHLPGAFELVDTFGDRQMLLDRVELRGEIRYMAPGANQDRSLSWLDSSVAADLAADGKTVLINEIRGGVYLRRADESEAVQLGDGEGMSLSSDGAHALVRRQGQPPHLVVVPTRAGETKTLKNDRFERFDGAEWLPDGKRILFAAVERGHGPRIYAEEVESERVVELTAEGIEMAGMPSPDGKWIIVNTLEGLLALFPVDGSPASAPRPIAGAEGVAPIGWTADGRSLYVQDAGEYPARVYVLSLDSGKRKLFREFMPTTPTGIVFSTVHVTPDARSWAYTYVYKLSDLYLAEWTK
jgi:eukaryotic-like serine/threonine-protein kinase